MSEHISLEALLPEMIAWRRHLHRNPELSQHEKKTADFIAGKLRGLGIPVRTGVGGYGVVGEIRGSIDGPTVALRADIDALPIQDLKTCDYVSEVPGVMHACGHDAHTSTLLGVAKWFKAREEQLAGTIRLIFQPAEEVSPGGAMPMIREGVLDGVDRIYGVHLWTPFPAGHVYCAPGPFMAAADEFRIEVRGKGGHGGLPHETIDSILIASQLIGSMQTVVSRSVDPIEPCVVSVGSIHGGTGFNIIAESCEIIGTVRSFSESTRQKAEQRLRELAEGTCSMYGADVGYEYKRGYPPVCNDATEAERFFRIGRGLFGDEHVHRSSPIMAGEDFAYYLEKVPGCFMFVGAGSVERGIIHPHHHPKFDIAEEAMLAAARLLIGMASDALGYTEPM
jgi:amidohydrolase